MSDLPAVAPLTAEHLGQADALLRAMQRMLNNLNALGLKDDPQFQQIMACYKHLGAEMFKGRQLLTARDRAGRAAGSEGSVSPMPRFNAGASMIARAQQGQAAGARPGPPRPPGGGVPSYRPPGARASVSLLDKVKQLREGAGETTPVT